jgi:hypothetical protein
LAPRLDPGDPLYMANMDKTQQTAERRAAGMDMSHGAHGSEPQGHEHQQ